MKSKTTLLALSFLGIFAALFTACQQEDGPVDEYADWQKRNDDYYNKVYAQAQTNADGQWRIIRNYSLNEAFGAEPTNNIVAHVEKEFAASSQGESIPLFTDTVMVHYQGHLMPTAEHPAGVAFDRSWSGSYDPRTMMPAKFAVSGVVDGFATALQNMRPGDRWTVYIPYKLGYGISEKGSIPACSTLVFDITLVSTHHPGKPVPAYQ